MGPCALNLEPLKMTCIVSPEKYPTKKALREAVKQDPAAVQVRDPSIFRPWVRKVAEMRKGEEVVVTNHPKRNWFAQVGRTPEGEFYVK